MVHLSNVCFYVRFGRFFPVIGKVISIEKPISNPETIGSRFFFNVVDLRGLTGTSFKSNVDQFHSRHGHASNPRSGLSPTTES